MSVFDRFAPTPRLVARLVADRGLHTTAEADGAAHGVLVAPGLRQVVVLVRGSAVSGPVDPAEHGGQALCQRVGLAGLHAQPQPRHATLTADGAHVETFVSDDVFGASRLLVLDGLLAELLLVERPAHGVLVVAPNRHLLAVHVLQSIDTVPAALRLLSELALAEHQIAEPVSPWIYYRSPDGTLSLLSSAAGARGLDSRFDAALRAMASADG